MCLFLSFKAIHSYPYSYTQKKITHMLARRHTCICSLALLWVLAWSESYHTVMGVTLNRCGASKNNTGITLQSELRTKVCRHITQGFALMISWLLLFFFNLRDCLAALDTSCSVREAKCYLICHWVCLSNLAHVVFICQKKFLCFFTCPSLTFFHKAAFLSLDIIDIFCPGPY